MSIRTLQQNDAIQFLKKQYNAVYAEKQLQKNALHCSLGNLVSEITIREDVMMNSVRTVIPGTPFHQLTVNVPSVDMVYPLHFEAIYYGTDIATLEIQRQCAFVEFTMTNTTSITALRYAQRVLFNHGDLDGTTNATLSPYQQASFPTVLYALISAFKHHNKTRGITLDYPTTTHSDEPWQGLYNERMKSFIKDTTSERLEIEFPTGVKESVDVNRVKNYPFLQKMLFCDLGVQTKAWSGVDPFDPNLDIQSTEKILNHIQTTVKKRASVMLTAKPIPGSYDYYLGLSPIIFSLLSEYDYGIKSHIVYDVRQKHAEVVLTIGRIPPEDTSIYHIDALRLNIGYTLHYDVTTDDKVVFERIEHTKPIDTNDPLTRFFLAYTFKELTTTQSVSAVKRRITELITSV